MAEREGCKFEINGELYDCVRWMEGENYILNIIGNLYNKNIESKLVAIKIKNERYFFFMNVDLKIEDVERNLEAIYEEDIERNLGTSGTRFTFKSTTPEFYTSPIYNSNGIKPKK
jgi:hypothetical protein